MQTKALLRFLLPLAFGLVAARGSVQTSDIQGLLQTSAPANTDTLVSPAFGRVPVWAGAVQSVSGNTITVSGTPAWTANQYAPGSDTYYVRPLTGTLRGHFFTVASNASGSVLVDNLGLNLAQLTAGDRLELVPYWTLGTLYPASQAGVSFIASSSTLSHQTELYFYDPSGAGINRAPATGYYFFNGSWRKNGGVASTVYDSVVVAPDTYILQRNKAAATTLTLTGRVHPGRLSTFIETQASTKQDNYMAVSYPMPITLRNTGLAGTAAFTTSTSSLSHADELLVFDSTQTGINRAPSATYFYFNSGWRKSGTSVSTDFSDSVTLAPGSGFIVRRATTGSTAEWAYDTGL